MVPGGSTEFYKEDVVPSLDRPEEETTEKGPLLKEEQHHYIPFTNNMRCDHMGKGITPLETTLDNIKMSADGVVINLHCQLTGFGPA